MILKIAFFTTLILIVFGYLYNYYNKNRKNKDQNQDEEEYVDWLNNIEPIFRHIKTYPEDWRMRREYVARRSFYTCEECGKQGEVGFQVHHIIPISQGGDNSFENLMYLCVYCHENKHPHMFYRRFKKIKLKHKKSKKR
jgi:5-methylcytosine-specific restriction endonuclease McrA